MDRFRLLWDSTLGERARLLIENKAGSNPAPRANEVIPANFRNLLIYKEIK